MTQANNRDFGWDQDAVAAPGTDCAATERRGYSTCTSMLSQGRFVPVKILVVGSGGREHALAWKLKQSSGVDRLFCAPGNAGTEEIADNVEIKASDLSGLARFGKENAIDLTVIGPDDPLAAGIVDLFEEEGLRIFGPTKS